MGLMSEDRLTSESRDPGPVRRDRKSEESFEPLAEIITGELLADAHWIGLPRPTVPAALRS